jgi:hypothetical protein
MLMSRGGREGSCTEGKQLRWGEVVGRRIKRRRIRGRRIERKEKNNEKELHGRKKSWDGK